MKTDELKTLAKVSGASGEIDLLRRQVALVLDADNKLGDYWSDIGRLDDLEAARFEFDSVFPA